jgi:hypothetical protein
MEHSSSIETIRGFFQPYGETDLLKTVEQPAPTA